ncbi:MAG: hypothetical protein WBQ23_14750 [Bacteroidota bacterium]
MKAALQILEVGLRYGVMLIVLMMGVGADAHAQDREPPMQRLVELASEPSGAEIFSGDSLLGKTPMRVQLAQLDSIAVWYPARDSWNAQVLRPGKEGPNAGEGVRFLRFDARALFLGTPAGRATKETQSLRLPSSEILLPAGASLLAGIAAVMLKQSADAYYSDYLQSGDESLLSQTKKYDIYAGVSLALLQVGLGYFIYRLFDE